MKDPRENRQVIREFKKRRRRHVGRHKKNSDNEQNNETARANLNGFSAVLFKTTRSNEHFQSFVENVVVRREFGGK